MFLEGILIHKAIYKERDLIGTLLLREGNLVSFYFYGGRGGGKSQKGSILELGFMLRVKLPPNIKKKQDIHIAKDWELIWSSEEIRKNHEAFYLSTFYFEIIKKIALPKDMDLLGVENLNENEGIFKVLSNSLVLIDTQLKSEQFHLPTALIGFLSKLTFELGVTPDIDRCLFCSEELMKNFFIFDVKNGGFVCKSCSNETHSSEVQLATLLQFALAYSKKTKFTNFSPQYDLKVQHARVLISYLCYHYEWDISKFLTLKLIL